MKILVDTSVWSLLLHRKKQPVHPAALFLRDKIETGAPLYITGVIRQEILQGVRSETQLNKLKNYLSDFDSLEATSVVHEKAAVLFNRCREKGVSAHTIDCLIATLAMHHNYFLLTTDDDFQNIARCSPVELKIVNF